MDNKLYLNYYYDSQNQEYVGMIAGFDETLASALNIESLKEEVSLVLYDYGKLWRTRAAYNHIVENYSYKDAIMKLIQNDDIDGIVERILFRKVKSL